MTHLAHLGFLGGADGAGSSGTDAGSLALRDLSVMPFDSRAAHTCTNGEGGEAQPPHQQLPVGFLCGGCAQGTSSGDAGTAAESPHASPCAGEGATAQMPTLLWGGTPASCGHQGDARPGRKKLKAVWVEGVDLQAVESAVTFCKQTEEDELVVADGSTSACGEGPLNGRDGRCTGRALALEVHVQQLPDVASMQQVSLTTEVEHLTFNVAVDGAPPASAGGEASIAELEPLERTAGEGKAGSSAAGAGGPGDDDAFEICGQDVSLAHLRSIVEENGGWERCCEDKKWPDVVKHLCIRQLPGHGHKKQETILRNNFDQLMAWQDQLEEARSHAQAAAAAAASKRKAERGQTALEKGDEEAAAGTKSEYKCSRCGQPKKGHTVQVSIFSK